MGGQVIWCVGALVRGHAGALARGLVGALSVRFLESTGIQACASDLFFKAREIRARGDVPGASKEDMLERSVCQ